MTAMKCAKAAFAVAALALSLPCLGGEGEKAKAAESAAVAAAPVVRPATLEQMTMLTQVQKQLTTAGRVLAKVKRRSVVGMLAQEKIAEGELVLSKGRIRMDVETKETKERQLLLVGDKAFWAVSYPPASMKDAAVQVVTGPVSHKKAGGQGFIALLGKSGFLKSFTVTGVALAEAGMMRYYLQPKTDWVEAKRALIALAPAKDGGLSLREIQIWDSLNNETSFVLENVKLEKKIADAKQFEFTPPKNADVMPIGN